jgi:hypothetical protein
MSDEWIEQKLRTMPLKAFPGEAAQRISNALQAAETPRSWTQRPVLLWHAAAACLVTGVFAFSAARAISRSSQIVEPGPRPWVSVEQRLFASNAAPEQGLNISSWAPLPGSQGE